MSALEEPWNPIPMPDEIWVESSRELAVGGDLPIQSLEVVAGPDLDSDYPYQEVARYLRFAFAWESLAAELEAEAASYRDRASRTVNDGLSSSYSGKANLLFDLAGKYRVRAARGQP